MRLFAPRVFAQLFCITLLLLSVSPSHAQVPTQADVPTRSRALWSLRREVKVDQRRQENLLVQRALRDDYRRLQVVNNDLQKRVFKPSGTQTISDKEIKSSLGEIKKLADRLRLNFGLPKVEPNEPANDLALKPGLQELDQAVMGFVDNPLLRELRVYDTKLADQAAKDLSDTARLADTLRRLIKEK